MDIKVKDGAITQHTKALCEAIVQQSDFQTIKEKLDAFLKDELLKFQYQQVNDLGQLLQMKHERGIELKEEEINQFETLRQDVLGNSVVQGFMEAQQQLHQLHQFVGTFLDKTFELGRLPDYEDVDDGSCGGFGGDCGCH